MRKLVPVVLLLAAACGDDVVVDPAEQDEAPGLDGNAGDLDVAPIPHLAPVVCGVRAWPQIPFAGTDVDLSVAEMPLGVRVFTVDRAGGAVRGFVLDQYAELQSTQAGTVFRSERMTAASAAYIDEQLITASVADDGSVFIDRVQADLSGFENISTARGTMIADLPVAHVRGQRFTPFADADDGISGIRFDDKWKMSSTDQLSAKAPLSITATRYLDDTIVAWSTNATCHLTRVGAGRMSSRSFACVGARLAVDPVSRSGFMVYAQGDDVMISQIKIGAESELANTRVLVMKGTAPKIAFDGTRFWVSYVNERHDVVVGYVGKTGSLVSMAVEGTRPQHEAYDLMVVHGDVWMYAVDEAGLGAHQFCLKPV